MYLQYQLWGKNGSYWFYESGTIKPYTTDPPTFPLRDTHPRIHQDSVTAFIYIHHHPYTGEVAGMRDCQHRHWKDTTIQTNSWSSWGDRLNWLRSFQFSSEKLPSCIGLESYANLLTISTSHWYLKSSVRKITDQEPCRACPEIKLFISYWVHRDQKRLPPFPYYTNLKQHWQRLSGSEGIFWTNPDRRTDRLTWWFQYTPPPHPPTMLRWVYPPPPLPPPYRSLWDI